MTLTLPQTVQQGTQRGQLHHLHPVRTSLDGTMGEGQQRTCVCVLVFHHLHGLCEDDAVQTDQVLVVQRMHSVHLSDEIVQTVRVQHVSLQTLHRHS